METTYLMSLIYGTVFPVLITAAGFGVRAYMKWAKIWDLRLILGSGMYSLKLMAYMLMTLGVMLLIMNLILLVVVV